MKTRKSMEVVPEELEKYIPEIIDDSVFFKAANLEQSLLFNKKLNLTEKAILLIILSYEIEEYADLVKISNNVDELNECLDSLRKKKLITMASKNTKVFINDNIFDF